MTEKQDNGLALTANQLQTLENCRLKHQANLVSPHEDPDVYYLLKPNSFIVFRAPRRAEIQRFKGTVSDDKSNANARANADWVLAESIVLHPATKEEREALFYRRPMLLTDVAVEALTIAGDGDLKSSKKYESDTI